MEEVILLTRRSQPSHREWFLTFVDDIKGVVHEEIVEQPNDFIDLINEVNIKKNDMLLKFGKEKYIPNLAYADAILHFRHAAYTGTFTFSVSVIASGEVVYFCFLPTCNIPKRMFVAVFGREPEDGDALAVFVTGYKTHPVAQSLVRLSRAYKKRLYKE